MAIKFGTDGWRAVIAEDFTFDNVRLCAQGTADFVKRQNLASRGLIVGYDTRFQSEEFAAAVAEVTTGNGIVTFLCDKPAPTPVISYNLVTRNAGAGAIITASHNASQWNGFKYKPDYGGSASPQIVALLEERIARVEATGQINRIPLRDAEARGLLEYIDPEPEYLGHLATLVDLEGIRQAGFNIVFDPMFGAGAGYFTKLLAGGTTKVIEIRGERNPAFPGMSQPEPLAHNLGQLIDEVSNELADIGIATDGDADRVGIVDEDGRFMTTLQTFALLTYHHLGVLKLKGPIVRSITMTSMIDRLAALYDVEVFDTPVGFKHLGPVMMEEDALLAGEESGGYAFRSNIPERDGILSGLLILDLMVKTGETLSELLGQLFDKVGPHHYDRWDLEFPEQQRDSIMARVASAQPSDLAGIQVNEIDTRDGYRFDLEGGYWGLIRFSGTEPLLRIYAEAESLGTVAAILGELRAMTGV